MYTESFINFTSAVCGVRSNTCFTLNIDNLPLFFLSVLPEVCQFYWLKESIICFIRFLFLLLISLNSALNLYHPVLLTVGTLLFFLG